MNLIVAALFMSVGAATNAAPDAESVSAAARITSDTAYYDHQQGYACFRGHVFVDEAGCQLHADRAYVFLAGTNELKKIVALGNVAITNGTRRAYGEKATYFRKSSQVVLKASDTAPAEVRDEAKGGAQVVRGKTIRFWTETRQVAVEDAWLSAPRASSSKEDIKGLLGR